MYELGLIISKINPELLSTTDEDNCTTFSSNVQLSLPGMRKMNGVDGEKNAVETEDFPSPVDEEKEVLSDVVSKVSFRDGSRGAHSQILKKKRQFRVCNY